MLTSCLFVAFLVAVDPAATPATADDPLLIPVAAPARLVSGLDEALALAVARSANLHTALNEVRIAEAQTRVALAAALPTAVAQGILSQSFYPGASATVANDTFASPTLQPVILQFYAAGLIQVTQPVIAIQAWHAIGTARVGEDIARLSAEEVRRETLVGLAGTMLNVVTAERLSELSRSGLRSALSRLTLAETRERLGGATGQDVSRAREDRDVARRAVLSADEALIQAREAFGLGLGFAEQVGLAANAKIDDVARVASTRCRQLAGLDDRSDVRAARKKVELTQRSIVDTEAQFLPTLSVQALGAASTITDTPGVASSLWTIQGLLTVPIWDGGARYGQLRALRAQQANAEEALQKLERSATVEVERARRGQRLAEQLLEVASDEQRQAAEVDKTTQQAYRIGLGASLDLVSAATALRQAEVNLAVFEYQVVRARLASLVSVSTCEF